MKVLVLGNSGSGKSSYAKRLQAKYGMTHLDLDTVVWEHGEIAIARPTEEATKLLLEFISHTPSWCIEGCYEELIELALPFCTELVFLNPGLETCLANNRNRPWEKHKYSSPKEQQSMLDNLQIWVASYYTRKDAWSYHKHRELFDAFEGDKVEYTDLAY